MSAGRRSLAPLALVALILTGVFVAAAIAAPPTGDPQAIAFYQQQVTAYSSVKGATIKETGFLFAKPSGATVTYVFGATKPAGYSGTSDTVLYRLNHGNIQSYLVKAIGAHVNFRILMNGKHVYLGTGNCWYLQHGNAGPFGSHAGGSFLSIEGAAVQAQPNANTVVYTFPWGSATATAQETDVFSGSPPSISAHIVVSGSQVLSFTQKAAPLKVAPQMPLPKPLCH